MKVGSPLLKLEAILEVVERQLIYSASMALPHYMRGKLGKLRIN
jgi:hypothetical protein